MEYEFLDIVDENDSIIGKDTKENKFSKELISRNVAVFLRDSGGKFIIIQRAANKRSFPNRLDLASCGNVAAGESYEDAAAREMKEELGITCEIIMLKKVYNEFEENGKKLRYFTGIFLGKWDKAIKSMTLAELKTAIKVKPDIFTPGFVADFLAVKEMLS
jgi:16S rRNA (adenine1518-N6/adenine1519-N6)-dimethyltransferase